MEDNQEVKFLSTIKKDEAAFYLSELPGLERRTPLLRGLFS
jgi:hypothetical protein